MHRLLSCNVPRGKLSKKGEWGDLGVGVIIIFIRVAEDVTEKLIFEEK